MGLLIREYDLALGERRQRVKLLENEDLPQAIRKELARRGGHITRNSKCPCGSGKRFKRCCGLGVLAVKTPTGGVV